MKRSIVLAGLLALSSCQLLPHSNAPSGPAEQGGAGAVAASAAVVTFDNHEQVWTAREALPGGAALPHVVVSIESTARPEWSIWRVHLEATPPVDAVWAIQRVGSDLLLPHRALAATPSAGDAFDPGQWVPLQACALKGLASRSLVRVAADVGQCSALVPGIGASAALLPLEINREGEWLHLRLYVDQARGPTARSDLREVTEFSGWAAVNGAGPAAGAESSDWHMNRNVRLGSEGGRAALAWRDGKPSGFSLSLERLTYREGNVPVLKLSVIDDASGRALAYAWANPEATRIGINLGWLQVGLDRAGVRSPGAGPSRGP